MTDRYVWSGASGTGTGADFTNAYTTFGAAVTASTGGWDLIKVADDHNETLSANTTYTFAANTVFICVNRGTGAVSTGALISTITSAYTISLAGAFKVYGYGVEFRVAIGAAGISVNATTAGHFELESCGLALTTTSSTGAKIAIGRNSTNTDRGYTKLKNCTFAFGNAGQAFQLHEHVDIEGGAVNTGGSAPTTLFEFSGTGVVANIIGFDASHVTGTLVGNGGGQSALYDFLTCKLGSGVVVLAAQTTTPNKSGVRVRLRDSAAGDQHYHFGDFDAFGSTVVDTGIYANDGAQYDGTNRCSWKITTTANCSFYTPYVSPWFGRYHSAASAITPSIEILRDGSTTAYQDDEVWGEFSAKTTTGSTQATIYRDRMALMGTPADQAAGVGTSGWTGENASAWSGKLAPASSFTPAEIGHLMGRIIVGEPSITVYADPAIRGAV